MTTTAAGAVAAAAAAAATLALGVAGARLPGAAAAPAARTRSIAIHFPGPDGVRDSAVVLLPRWYGPHDHPRLPLVISPHSRGITPQQAARRWGDLPGRFRLIVVNPGLHGRVIPRRSWAWPPDIAEMTRLPRVLTRRIRYLRYDPARVYAAGDSMGGQEVLMLVARRPDLFAAAVAADPVTNFLSRWYAFPASGESRHEQAAATREVGATPRREPWLYVRRSPIFFARTFAFSDVPLELWWNPRDTVVIGEGRSQTGTFYRAIRDLNPRAPVVGRVDHVMHGWVFKYDHQLPQMVEFLLAHRRRPPSAAGFAYSSWRPQATIWGWRVRYAGPARRLWTILDVTPAGLRTAAAGRLVIRPPGAPERAYVDGRPVALRGTGVPVPPGRHRVELRYARLPGRPPVRRLRAGARAASRRPARSRPAGPVPRRARAS